MFEDPEFCNVKIIYVLLVGAATVMDYVLRIPNDMSQKRAGKLPLASFTFAPSPQLTAFIKNLAVALNQTITYRTADLLMQGVDDRVEIVDMTIYPDQHVDFLSVRTYSSTSSMIGRPTRIIQNLKMRRTRHPSCTDYAEH